MADESPSPVADQQPIMISNGRKRTNTIASVAHSVRSVTSPIQSVATDLLHKDPPPGFFAATAEAASHAPTLGEIRRGSYGTSGWRGEEQRVASPISERQRRVNAVTVASTPSIPSTPHQTSASHQPSTPHQQSTPYQPPTSYQQVGRVGGDVHGQNNRKDRRVYSSGYVPPPVVPWTTSTWIGLKAFWKWFLTPFGFLVTIYGLNVVAWGGMLFLLLCNASKPMCWAAVPGSYTDGKRSIAASLALNDGRYPRYYNCNDINSSRRVWIEIDSQILNALFCVTGFGLIPWRSRDLYYLMRFRLTSQRRSGYERKMYGLRVLAGVYRSWFRLSGSQTLDTMSLAQYERSLAKTDADRNLAAPTAVLESGSGSTHTVLTEDTRVPIPFTKQPDDPLTCVRAPPTALWKLDFFIWSQVGNTLFQAVLCGFMWGMTRYNRPPWATGLFITLACMIAGLGGLVSFSEGKKVKRVEGVRPAGCMDYNVEEVKLDMQPAETPKGHESSVVNENSGSQEG